MGVRKRGPPTRLAEGWPLLAQVYWRHVEEATDNGTGIGPCHVWTGPRHSKGYGRVSMGPGGRMLAHKVAWEIRHGAPPRGPVRHRCRVKLCVNPDHLRIDDPRPSTSAVRGEHNGRATATDEQVRAALKMLNSGATQAEVAAKFGVARQTVSNWKNGRCRRGRPEGTSESLAKLDGWERAKRAYEHRHLRGAQAARRDARTELWRMFCRERHARGLPDDLPPPTKTEHFKLDGLAEYLVLNDHAPAEFVAFAFDRYKSIGLHSIHLGNVSGPWIRGQWERPLSTSPCAGRARAGSPGSSHADPEWRRVLVEEGGFARAADWPDEILRHVVVGAESAVKAPHLAGRLHGFEAEVSWLIHHWPSRRATADSCVR